MEIMKELVNEEMGRNYGEDFRVITRPYQEEIAISGNELLTRYRELHVQAVHMSKLIKRLQIARDMTFSGAGILASGGTLAISIDYLSSVFLQTSQTISKPVSYVVSTITQSTPIISNNFDKGAATAIAMAAGGFSVYVLSKFIPITFEMIRSYVSDKQELYKENEKTGKLLVDSSDLKRLVIKK